MLGLLSHGLGLGHYRPWECNKMAAGGLEGKLLTVPVPPHGEAAVA